VQLNLIRIDNFLELGKSKSEETRIQVAIPELLNTEKLKGMVTNINTHMYVRTYIHKLARVRTRSICSELLRRILSFVNVYWMTGYVL
jgi:hypothetical protein